jgi:hypothetical protein
VEKFYETLDDTKREALFAEMRRLDAKAQSNLNSGSQSRSGNTVEMGGGLFEYRLKGEVINSFLRALRAGHRPIEAFHLAEIERTKIVQNWNTRRDKDYVTHRSEQAEQSLLEDCYRSVLRAVD